MLIEALQRRRCRSWILAVNANTRSSSRNGHIPEHMVGPIHPECESGHQVPDHDRDGSDEHASILGETIRCVAEYQDTNNGADENGV